MKFARKGSALLILLVICLYVLSLSDTALAKKSDKDKKKKEEKKSVKVEENAELDAANALAAQVRGVNSIPNIPESVPPGLQETKMMNTPALAAGADLEQIAQTQRDLEVLANRYDDFRKTHEEQLLSLRALASQAKIHAQLLDGIKANMVAAPAQNTVPPSALEASNLEKYRLIRERADSQKSMINEITQSQVRVKNALATINVPMPPPSVKPPAGLVAQPASLDATKMSRDLKVMQNAVTDAKEQQEKARAEKEKILEQEKAKAKTKTKEKAKEKTT